MRTLPVACIALAMTLAGCATPDPTRQTPPLEGTQWVLASLPDRDVAAAHAATLSFESGRMRGSDGCNRYSVSYRAIGSTLEVAPRSASTQMACAPDVLKQAEAFMAALASASAYYVADGQLHLLAADRSVLATLAPQSKQLAGTSWRATGVNNGKGAVASVVAGSTLTLDFDADGRASGTAGCNRFTAGYEARPDRGELRFSAPATTRMLCPDAGVMAQEQMFLDALQSVATMRMEGSRLELRRADGALALSLVAEGVR